LGESAVLDASRTEDHVQVVESAMVLRGSHQFGFGGSLQRVTLDSRLANRFAGVFLFPTLEDFTAGRPDVFLQAFGDPRTTYATVPLAIWAQDQWRPAPGLTIVGGVRYEAQKLPGPFGTATKNIAPRLGVA
jgi:outer membrane receptor protein involved in Fe transport